MTKTTNGAKPVAKPITDAEAQRLAKAIFSASDSFTDEANQVGAAVLRIIEILADENGDSNSRFINRCTIARSIYNHTRASCDAMEEFAAKTVA